MALLPILRYPDPRLHKKAARISEVTDEIRQLAASMAETMYAAPGIGLAATQVNRHIRLIIVDASDEGTELMTFINPEIIERSGQMEHEEGCLSVPGIYEPVKRSAWIRVTAQNLKGETFELEADGLLALCIQHEIDHLEGKVFVEYLSRLKQTRIKARLAKNARITA
jgi:peptide deformylase